MTLWEVDIYPAEGLPDQAGRQAESEAADLGLTTAVSVRAARGYLIQGDLDRTQVERLARELLADSLVERTVVARRGDAVLDQPPDGDAVAAQVHVLLKPGVTDPVAQSAEQAIRDFDLEVQAVRTLRKYWIAGLEPDQLTTFCTRVLANESVERVVHGPLDVDRLEFGSAYDFQLVTVPIRELDDAALEQLSRTGQLYLSLV